MRKTVLMIAAAGENTPPIALVTLESHGVRVVVDPISLPYLEGSVVDYKDGLIGAGFSFDNPNVAATCGCNSSFQAKDGIEGPYGPKPGNGCS